MEDRAKEVEARVNELLDKGPALSANEAQELADLLHELDKLGLIDYEEE